MQSQYRQNVRPSSDSPTKQTAPQLVPSSEISNFTERQSELNESYQTEIIPSQKLAMGQIEKISRSKPD